MVSFIESSQQNSQPRISIKKLVNKGTNYFERSSTISWLFSDSIEMTNPRKVGFLLFVVIIGVILSPSALSSSDPFHVQESIKNFQNFWLSFENVFKTNDSHYSSIISDDYEVIDSARHKVVLNLKLNITNPDGGSYIIPGVNEIIKGQKF